MDPTRLSGAGRAGSGRRGRAARALRVAACAAVLSLPACGNEGPPATVLVATTSTYDSGLLEQLVTEYEAANPEQSVKAIAVGSGEALELGRRGDADLLLVHSPVAERRFVAEGHGRDRVPLMYNDFLLVGPPGDPAGVAGMRSAAEALRRIARSETPFLSRGDDSGTHRRELELWRRTGDVPEADWYGQTGQGQAETLQVASERGAYTLADRATFANLEPTIHLRILVEHDPALINVYSLIRVTDAANPDGTEHLFDWLTSSEGREAIARFGGREEGTPVFVPLVVGDDLPFSDSGSAAEPVAPADSGAAPDSGVAADSGR